MKILRLEGYLTIGMKPLFSCKKLKNHVIAEILMPQAINKLVNLIFEQKVAL
jgi:hypothetical protein